MTINPIHSMVSICIFNSQSMFRFNSASQRATTSPAWNISPSLAHSQAKFLVNILLCYWCMCSSPCSSSLGFFFSWLELLSRVGQPMLVSMDTFSQLNLDMYYARMNASEISDLKVPADWVSNHPILIMLFCHLPHTSIPQTNIR